MLSAVESFGPAPGPSAAHPYAHHHHNPYAIAAAAAAAGSAAAAAAAVVIPQAPLTPTTPTHPSSLPSQQQFFQSQQQLLLQPHHQQHHLGYFLPPPPTSLALISPPPTSPSSCSTTSNSNSTHSNNLLPTAALVLTSKCSPLQLAEYSSQHHHQQLQQHQQQQQYHNQKQQLLYTQQQHQHSPADRSIRRGALQQQQQDGVDDMSSAEFARPHPKQPRYSSGNNQSIPMHQRSPNNTSKTTAAAANTKSCLNNNDKHLNLNSNGVLKNGYACRTPPTKYSSHEQSGPVNLVTNQNNSSSSHLISSIHCRLSNTPPDGNCSSSSSSLDVENDGSMSPIGVSMANRKNQVGSSSSMLFGGSSSGVPKLPYDSAAAAAAVAAAAYQFNFPHLYASRAALYGASGLFSGHHTALAPPPGTLRPHPSYLSGSIGQPHDNSSTSFSAAYMQAVQNIYNHPTVQAPQPSPPPTSQAAALQHSKNVMCTPTGSMLAMATPSSATSMPTSASALSNGHSALSLATPNDLRQKSSHAPPSAPLAVNGAGTYLNGKVNNTPPAAEADNFFKVPSGKEGSLKHRILTRPSQQQASQPQPDKTEARSVSVTAAVVRAKNSTTNFTKGAYIELANGVLRRVEDMRTEDFIQCAERSPNHQLAESTVVKISTTPNNNVVITFSYDKNRSKADVEVSPEHPFFVYGQGWASYNPELSHKLFALKCQRLQVGDICISLTSRDPASNITPHNQPSQSYNKMPHASQISPPSSHMSGVHNDGDLHPLEKRVGADALATQPQNLSRKLHPALQENSANGPTAATLTSRLSNTLAAGYPPLHSMPPLHMIPPHLPTHHSYADIAELAAAYAESDQISRNGGLSNAPPPPQNHLSPSGAIGSYYQHHHALQQQQQHIFHTASMPIQLTRPPSTHHNSQPYYESPPSSTDGDPRRNHSGSSSGGGCDDEQDQPVDASMSRKRRWSAPESICDDDDVEHPPKHAHLQSSDSEGAAAAASPLSGYRRLATAAAHPMP